MAVVPRPARRFIAFLRALNVGGHVVKMDALKRHFERLGFADVETFIASGNVVFSARLKALETDADHFHVRGSCRRKRAAAKRWITSLGSICAVAS